MENELIKEKLYKDFTSKNINEIILIDDPIFKLVSDFNKIKEITNGKNTTKYIYFNKDKIHKILYDNEDIIEINEQTKKQSINFNDYFYLCLLISDNKSIVNYNYHFDYINSIYLLIDKKKSIQTIIISKCILELIENYIAYDNGEEEQEQLAKQLNEIKICCEDNIEQNAKIINLSKDDIISKNIDEIYIQIIIALIENNNFENDDIINIMNELCLESINITETMYNKLSEFLNINESVRKYEILNVNSLFEIKIINFYYILFKYILKNSYYIYNNSFLLKARKKILSFIKNKSLLEIKSENKEKLEFILNKFLDSTYYINYTIELNNNSNIFNFNSTYSFSKKSNSRSFRNDNGFEDNNDSNDNKNEIWYKILTNSTFEIEIIKYKNEFSYKYNKIMYDKDKIIKYDDFKKIEGDNKSNNYFKLFKEFLTKLENCFKLLNNNNIKINLKIKFKGVEFNDNFKVSCIYIFKNPRNERMLSFKDINILSEYSETDDGFLYLIDEIYSHADLLKYKNEEKIQDNLSNILDLSDKDDYKYSIIKLVKIIENPEKSNLEFIKELSNGFYICGSNDHKLIIYDKLYEQKIQYKNLNNLNLFEFPNSICEINGNQKKENEIQLFVCLLTHLVLIKINLDNFTFNKFETKIGDMNWVQCIETKDNNYIFFGDKSLHHLCEMPSKIIENFDKINNYSIKDKKYIDGIKINDNIVALSSNSVYNNGEDKLVFYNVKTKNITYEIKGFSFTNSLNGFSLMNINNNSSLDKILLCACTKYNNNQKNGILLVNPLLKYNEQVYYHFLETDFEVQCFCPIIDIKNNNNIINKSNNKSIATLYFLTGGFDEEKRRGVINLFKIFSDEKDLEYKIQFISEVVIDEEFNRINCIIQSKETGDILITCNEDSNVYIFKFNDDKLN